VVSIGKIAVGQHAYYEQQVAQGADDYYTVAARFRASGRAPARRLSALGSGVGRAVQRAGRGMIRARRASVAVVCS